MGNFKTSPQYNRLVNGVQRRFVAGGWQILSTMSDSQDFIVTCGNLRYPITCIDSSLRNFRSIEAIIDSIEKGTRVHRSNVNRIYITVLDENFLNLPLDDLLHKRLFVTTLDQIEEVTSLAKFAREIPEHLSNRQEFLTRNDPGYALSVARLLHEKRDGAQAIEWLTHAVSESSGFTQAHIELFTLYKAFGRLKEAESLANYMESYRPDDPRVIKLMLAYAEERGDAARAEIWKDKLNANNSVPRTFTDIVEKQREARRRMEGDDGISVAGSGTFTQAGSEQADGLLFRWLRALKLVR